MNLIENEKIRGGYTDGREGDIISLLLLFQRRLTVWFSRWRQCSSEM
jgi:hypothetical protein